MASFIYLVGLTRLDILLFASVTVSRPGVLLTRVMEVTLYWRREFAVRVLPYSFSISEEPGLVMGIWTFWVGPET